MFWKKWLPCAAALAMSFCFFVGCSMGSDDSSDYTNPGDSLGGGGVVSESPTESDSQNVQNAIDCVSEVSEGLTSVPADATALSVGDSITQSGNYVVTGTFDGTIEIGSEDNIVEGVVLYLSDATLTYKSKVIDCYGDLTITLIGENSITNTNTSGKNAVSCDGDLVINGSGSLSVSSTKNAIKANSISVVNATLDLEAVGDGLHAEVGAYDDATEEPTPSYDDGGYVYLKGATVEIVSGDDGIQADTFVYITGESVVTVEANGGAPETITESSSDSAEGKGIKAGNIDWGADNADIDWDGYLIVIESGDIAVNSNDDAVHSNAEIEIEGGTLTLSSGDDAMHADDLLTITGGSIAVDKCYEGVEAAKVEIYGGTVEVQSYEDGINAADGSQTVTGSSNSNCHIIIAGGYVSVNCIGSEGDGIDSNGTILISGGEVYVAGSSNSSDAALDADGGILVNGGYVFAVGALGMVETPATNSAQYCVSFAKSSAVSSGTTLYLCDSEGNVIMYFVTPRSCQSMILSCPEFVQGGTYSIYGGDSLLATFTISSTITSVGSSATVSNPSGSPSGSQTGTNVPNFGGKR